MTKMALKKIELIRAENLSEEFRKEKKLPSQGTILVETLNSDLRTEFKAMPDGGIREYFLSLGEFNESKID